MSRFRLNYGSLPNVWLISVLAGRFVVVVAVAYAFAQSKVSWWRQASTTFGDEL